MERTRRAGVGARLVAAALLTLPAPLVGQEPVGDTAEATDSTAVLYGTVRETETGRPLEDAEVRVVGGERAVLTDSAGGFRLTGLPPGDDSVRVEYLSGRSRVEYVWLDPGGVTRLDVELDPRAVEVAELQVDVERIRDRRMREIREREQRFSGQVVTRKELEERAPGRTTDALRGLSGVRVRYVPPRFRGAFTSEYVVLLRRGRCRPQIFVDGSPVQNISVDEFDPDEILALEVYQRGMAPARFTSMRGCGAVLIWLRHGGG